MNTATAVTIAALAALTPTVTCLIGIILQRQDVRDLRYEMGALRNSLQTDMAPICWSSMSGWLMSNGVGRPVRQAVSQS